MIFDFLKKRVRVPETVIHLDYAAGTPVHPEVLRAMLPYFSETWANPSALYRSAVRVRAALDEVRTELARVLRIRPYDVIFTSGGTESNTLALVGLVEAKHKAGRAYETMEVISTESEHPSILATLDVLAARGVQIRYVAQKEDGLIDETHFETLLSPGTVLVTFAYVNSEIGVIQPVKQLSRMVRAYERTHDSVIRVHVDASQAPLWLSCELDRLDVDLMTLDAGKCYGPKGVGVLALRRGVLLEAQLRGGGQEHGLRATTENVPLIIGCVRALVRAQASWEDRGKGVVALREYFIDALTTAIPDCVVNGSQNERVANNVNISIPGLDTEFAVIVLDASGIAASTRSACGTGEGSGSHVVRVITRDYVRAQSTLRFTLGEETTKTELTHTVSVLKAHVDEMRAFHKTLRACRSTCV